MKENVIWMSWSILLTTAFILYFIYMLYGNIHEILKRIALITKSPKRIYVFVRKIFWTTAKYKIRLFIDDHCKYNLNKSSSTVSCIMMYELDCEKYKTTFIVCGYDKLRVIVLSQIEEITHFVFDWRKIKDELTSEEILQLYLNETKP